MAITVSAEFKAIWEEKQGKAIHQRIGYKRRYKLAGTYFTEAAWTYLEKHEFVSLGSIPQQADVRRNVIKTSAMTLKVPNENNQWIEHASSPSFYAADNVATDGYKATRTQWRLEEGYELASGSIEWIAVFTGVQLKLPKITGKGESALIEIYSNAILLEKADAEKVGEEPALENCIPATGDGTNKAFESTSTGVDHAKVFEVNGSNLTQGSAWRVANDNEISSAGNTGRLAITAAAAPLATQTVKTKVKRWLQNKTIEHLLGLLADEAGIASASRTILPVLFPGSLSGSKTIDAQADWEAGTVLTNINTTYTPGSIIRDQYLIDDFADGEYTSGPAWENTSAAFNGNSQASIVATRAYMTANGSSLPNANATGSLRTSYLGGIVGTWECKAEFISGGESSSATVDFGGISIFFNGTSGLVTVNGIACGAIPAGEKTWRITRTAAGAVTVYQNGVSVGAGTVADYTPSAYVTVSAYAKYSPVVTLYADSLHMARSVVPSAALINTAAVFESAILDILSIPTAWGTLDRTETLNGGTIAYETASSSDGVTFDAYVGISAAGVIQSALKRYFKVRASITPLAATYLSPECQKLVANFSVSSVNVTLAMHRGRNVIQQVEQYVRIPDYELRFRGDGTMVIGPKTTSAYVLHLTQENGIIDVTEVDYGIPDRVVRAARVRYQGFVSVYGDTEAVASAATIADGDELGKPVTDENLDDILLANDVNLGISRARVLYDNNRRSATDPRPRVRIRLRIWDAPWLEVGDVVRVDFYDHPLLASLQANDELLRADSPWLHMGAPGNVISASKDWRILYYNPNKDTGQADIFCEEVL